MEFKKPPELFKSVYKRYQRISIKNLQQDAEVVDLSRGLLQHQRHGFTDRVWISASKVNRACREYIGDGDCVNHPIEQDVRCFESVHLPGMNNFPLKNDVDSKLISCNAQGLS